MRGSVRKRKDGRWEGRVELPKVDGKRKQKYVYADTRRECQRLVNELIHDIETGQFTDSGRLTVKGYMTNWFAVYRGKLAKSTQKSHGNYINNHIIPYFNEQRLKDLKPIDIDRFYNYERGKGYSEKTILQVHRILSRALTDAVFNRLIPYNPCQSVKAPSPAEFNPMVPDVDLYFDMLAAATGTEHEIPILLAGLCGLRRSEVFGLTFNDIDWDNSTLTVRQVVVMAGEEVVIKSPKTKKSARVISVLPEVLEVLKQKKSVGYVASRTGNVEHPGNYADRYRKFLKRNKLPHIRFHDLRHFHATLLLDAGVDMRLAQARLGHSNIGMTEKYQHIRRRPKADFETVMKIEDYLKKFRVGQMVGQIQKTKE